MAVGLGERGLVASGADRAATTSDAFVDGGLPVVPALAAAPPLLALAAAARDCVGRVGTVAVWMPFGGEIGTFGGKRETGGVVVPAGAGGAAALVEGAGLHTSLPAVTAHPAEPPHPPAAAGGDLAGLKWRVAVGVPLVDEVGTLTGQRLVLGSGAGRAAAAVTATVHPCLPLVAALAASPPHLAAAAVADVAGL